jgi:hypothetical protein
MDFCTTLFYILELCPRQGSKFKNKQRAITPIIDKAGLWFFCIALLLNEIYLPKKFVVNTPCGISLSRTKVKVWYKQRTRTLKLGKAELQFFCTALLLNEIYLQNISWYLLYILSYVQDKKSAMDWPTNQQTDHQLTPVYPHELHLYNNLHCKTDNISYNFLGLWLGGLGLHSGWGWFQITAFCP